VETLLLRWTMLDRIVDLAQVLHGTPPVAPGGGPERRGALPSRPSPGAGQAGVSQAGASRAAERVPVGSSPPPRADSSAQGPAPSEAAPLAAAAGVSAGVSAGVLEAIPAQLDAVRMSWSSIVAEVRTRSRFLGEALAATVPAGLDLPWLTVSLAEANPLFADRLQLQAQVVEEVLRQAIGAPVRLRVTEAASEDAPAAAAPRKLTESSIKADRLRTFRAKDPTLDTAADALDLEIVD
jgi:hypothetical protein